MKRFPPPLTVNLMALPDGHREKQPWLHVASFEPVPPWQEQFAHHDAKRIARFCALISGGKNVATLTVTNKTEAGEKTSIITPITYQVAKAYTSSMCCLVVSKQDKYLKNSKQSISTRLRTKVVSGAGSPGADQTGKDVILSRPISP